MREAAYAAFVCGLILGALYGAGAVILLGLLISKDSRERP